MDVVVHDGWFPAVVGRCSDYDGPGGSNGFLHDMFFKAALAGKPMRALLAGDRRTAGTTCPKPPAGSPPWAHAPRVTGGSGSCPPPHRSPRPRWPSTSTACWTSRQGQPDHAGLFALRERVLPADPRGRKVAHQFDRPWVVDATAFEATVEPIALTDNRSAIAATLTGCAASSRRPASVAAAPRPRDDSPIAASG